MSIIIWAQRVEWIAQKIVLVGQALKHHEQNNPYPNSNSSDNNTSIDYEEESESNSATDEQQQNG